MDTVANTQDVTKNQKLSVRKKKLKRHILKEAQAMRNSRIAYYEQRTLFDYALEDIGLLQGLFSKLDDFRFFDLDLIVKACNYFLVHADCEMKVKDDLSEKLSNLQNFYFGLAGYQNLISERNYYYSALWDKLEEMAEYQEC